MFEQGWPAGYSRAGLDPYYDLVAYMLDINPITKARRGLPTKTQLMREVADKLHRSDQFCYPNIAVDLGPGTPHLNKFQAEQSAANTNATDCPTSDDEVFDRPS